MAPEWDSYKRPREGTKTLSAWRLQEQDRLTPLKNQLRQVILQLQPDSVACFGAGILNDIPYSALVESGARIHLLDWIPDAIDFGIAHSLIKERDGRAACLYCRLNPERAKDYCQGFDYGDAADGTCAAYEEIRDPELTCASFVRGTYPSVHMSDVTGGFAQTYARKLPHALKSSTSWRQAFKNAGRLARTVCADERQAGLKNSTIDLAVSSLVISQFDYEPLTFFRHLAEERLGRASDKQEQRLDDGASALRTLLRKRQVGGHFQEIQRVLRPDGVCYLSFELFHRADDSAVWSIVPAMHEVLGGIEEYFDLDFDLVRELKPFVRIHRPKGESWVFQALLRPKG